MPVCGRCGQPFPLGSQSMPPMSPGARRDQVRSMPIARPPKSRRISPWLFMLGGVFLLACIFIGSTMMARALRGLQAAGSLVGSGAPTDQPPMGAQDFSSGLFKERSGASESPTIHIINHERGLLRMTLRAENGREFVAQSSDHGTTRIQVPAGHYTVGVTSDQPGIAPNYGDAAFRRFKEYDADFVFAADNKPLHLGD